MKPRIGSVLAEFTARRGYPVYEAAGLYWTPFEPGSRFLMTIPDHVTVDGRADEIDRLLRDRKMFAARYPTANPNGVPGGYYVWRRRPFGLEQLDRKLRNTLRRAFDACRIAELDPTDLKRYGLPLNRDTQQRQGRVNPEFAEPASWARFVDAARATPGMSFTGAFVDGQLAAYSLDCRADGWWYALYQNSSNAHLKSFVNHALDFYGLERASTDEGVAGVLNGTCALGAKEGLHEYKARFGYEVEAYSVAIHLHPWAAPAAGSRWFHKALRAAAALAPGNRRISQAIQLLGPAAS
jgi:hypothetical protein